MSENQMQLVIASQAEEQINNLEITFNFEELKTGLSERLQKYQNLVYSDANIAEAKADRALLNKLKEAMEKRRIEIKKQCEAPYKAFEGKIKELVGMVEKPINEIDKQVKSFEQIKKEEKKAGIKQFYEDRVGDLKGLVPFAKVFREEMLNTSFTEKKIQKEIMDLFIKVEGDLQAISNLNSEHELQIKDKYLQNYDLSAALLEKANLEEKAAKIAEYNRKKAEEKAEAERQAKQEEDAERNRQQERGFSAPSHVVSPPSDNISAGMGGTTPPARQTALEPQEPAQEVKKYEMVFCVNATIEQLKALRKFFDDNKIDFRKVD